MSEQAKISATLQSIQCVIIIGGLARPKSWHHFKTSIVSLSLGHSLSRPKSQRHCKASNVLLLLGVWLGQNLGIIAKHPLCHYHWVSEQAKISATLQIIHSVIILGGLSRLKIQQHYKSSILPLLFGVCMRRLRSQQKYIAKHAFFTIIWGPTSQSHVKHVINMDGQMDGQTYSQT